MAYGRGWGWKYPRLRKRRVFQWPPEQVVRYLMGDRCPHAGGDDIQCFVECLVGGGIAAGCNCDCADMQPDGLWDDNDVVPFVNELLNTTVCTWP